MRSIFILILGWVGVVGKFSNWVLWTGLVWKFIYFVFFRIWSLGIVLFCMKVFSMDYSVFWVTFWLRLRYFGGGFNECIAECIKFSINLLSPIITIKITQLPYIQPHTTSHLPPNNTPNINLNKNNYIINWTNYHHLSHLLLDLHLAQDSQHPYHHLLVYRKED